MIVNEFNLCKIKPDITQEQLAIGKNVIVEVRKFICY